MLEIVERAHENEDHLFVELDDVVPNEEDDGTEFTCNGNCILGVLLLVVFSSSFCNQALVDHPWFDRCAQLDEDLSVLELSIVESSDSLTRSFADPCKKVLFGFRSDDLQVVESDELPNDSKNVLSVRITNIFSSNTN